MESLQNIQASSNMTQIELRSPLSSTFLQDKSNIQTSSASQHLSWNTYIQGILRHIKFIQVSKKQATQDLLNQKILQKIAKVFGVNHYKQNQRKTMINMTKSDQLGFKLERRCDYNLPDPLLANNYDKKYSLSYSQQKINKRKFKGPLYNEAGKICHDLTEKYIPLENLKLTTILADLDHQFSFI